MDADGSQTPDRSNLPAGSRQVRRWRLVWLVALVGLVVGATVLEVWGKPPGWLGAARVVVVGTLHWVRGYWLTSGAVAAGAGIAAVVVPLYQARRKAAQRARKAQTAAVQRAEVARAARVALLEGHCWVDEQAGELPRVGQVDPVVLGVHPAAALPSGAGGQRGLDLPGGVPVYVPRDQDAELDAALARGGLVVLVGDSTAGKSRAAYEAVRRLPGDRRLLVPHGRGSLRVLLDGGVQLRDVVVWLDDFERFLGGQGGLDVGLLRRVVGDGARRVVVVATMRASEYAARNVDAGQEDPPAERELRQVERAVLAVASRVEFARRFSPAELRRAAERAHDPRIADALAHAGQYGLAEYVAAGPVLWRRWRDGLAVDNPAERLAGAAITAVAVDCRRAGLTGALPEALLAELFLDYLEVPVARRVGSEAFEAGLGWAARPVQATSALLLPIEGGWVAFDYLVDQHQADTAAPPVPDGTWAAAVRLAAPDDALAVATAAYLAGQHEIAEQATRKAAEAGDHDAEYNLGVLLQEQGQGEEAEQWYRKAAGAGHHRAENNLGVLLQEQGQGEEAEQWYRKAAGAGHHPAENNLGALLQQRGELEEAEQWWRRAAGAGDHAAENNLGALFKERGELEEAEQWWRRAAGAGDHDAENNLGALLKERGELEEAEQWWRRAVGAGHYTAGHYAAENNLGMLLKERGELEEAEQWWRRAAGAGDHDAEVNLGVLLQEQGRAEEAERWWRKAADAGHRDAEYNLSVLLQEQGRAEEAEEG